MSFDPPAPRSLEEYEALPTVLLPQESADRAIIPVVIGVEGTVCPLVPNIGDWQAGDLILIRYSSRLRLSPVAIYQSALRGLPHGITDFTHVGIYDGDGHVWEANPSYNIRLSTLASVLGARPNYRVFRLRGSEIDSGRLTSICRHLRDTHRYPSYAEFIRPQTLLKLGARVLRPEVVRTWEHPDTIAGSLVCSTFAFQALSIAARRAVQINEPFIVPADFARADLFEEVPRVWYRTAPSHKEPQ